MFSGPSALSFFSNLIAFLIPFIDGLLHSTRRGSSAGGMSALFKVGCWFSTVLKFDDLDFADDIVLLTHNYQLMQDKV